MLKKFLSFILMIFIIALLGFLILLGFAVYSNFLLEDTVQTVNSSNSSIGIESASENEKINKSKDVGTVISELFNIKEEEKIEYSPQNSNGKFYYEQLNATQKLLYNGLQENKENMISGTYTVEYGNMFSDILAQENGTQILQDYYQTVIDAYTHDNPDLFYLDVGKLYLNIETTKRAWNTTYKVFISPEKGKTYYSDNFLSVSEVMAAKVQIETVRDVILSKLTTDRYKNIKLIHDYLVNSIDYDQTYNDIGTYDIYGALVKRKCVCDGYARAFKYLANSAGIECELIQGTATNSSGQTENHAWNAVLLDNKWYYIDVTWDDPVVIGSGFLLDKYHYRYFLKGTNLFSQDHKEDGKFTKEGKEFTYPMISISDY